MKQTHYSKCYKFHINVAVFIALFGLSSIVFAVWTHILAASIPLLAFGLFCVFWGVGDIVCLTREYIINESGIAIRYAKKWIRFHKWEEIIDVCVCRNRDAHRAATYLDVIWFNIGQPNIMPPQEDAGPLNMFFALTVEFSRERLQEIQKFYKGEIIDYRPTGLYVPPPREEYR